MSSKIFLQALQSKLKGGNARSIHLNALPGRLATRMDLKQLDLIDENLANTFLETILSVSSFEFKVSFDDVDLNELSQDGQKRLGIVSKRLNSIIIENEDYYKEHGTKTLGFGYPILIRRSSKDPSKIIKAPLFIWPLDAIKSKNKINEWTFFRNKVVQPNGKIVEADIHAVGINDVLLSFIKGEDDITLPNLTVEALEDNIIDKAELLVACADVLNALNSGRVTDYLELLKNNFKSPIKILPEAGEIDTITNNNGYIHFGGVFGLFRAQKESIITDISRLLDRYDEFHYENLIAENLSETPFSAVSTDPTQQAIINALRYETNQIIQGPPGTGKSQSLTALITNALANGLKCLVVCEKKTALDVIRRNIEKTNEKMASLVAVIDDVNGDREAIIDSVRDRQNVLHSYLNLERIKSKYISTSEKLKEITTSINMQHDSLAQPIYKGRTWDQIVGRFLQLRRQVFNIPLNNILNITDFKFLKDENELQRILDLLGKADNLFHQSKEMHEPLNNLSDNLFIDKTTGESRAEIEYFVYQATNLIPKLEDRIKEMQAASDDWINVSFRSAPEAIQKEFNPYLPFLSGDDFTFKALPTSFQLELTIEELANQLRIILIKATQLKQSYQNSLEKHYANYGDQLQSEISEYLSVVKYNIDLYGQIFMNNTNSARFKTNVLSLFSRKHKQIKSGRTEIKSRVENIRVIHLSKNYIDHNYNDHLETSNLSLYVNNIKELKKKTDEWALLTSSDILKYTDNITVSQSHPDFTSIKKDASEILLQYEQLTEQLKNRYALVETDSITEINSLILLIPQVLEQLVTHQHTFKLFRGHFERVACSYLEMNTFFENIAQPKNTRICKELYKPYNSFADCLERCRHMIIVIDKIRSHISAFRLYHDWQSYYLGLDGVSQKLIDIVAVNLDNSWEDSFECWYLFWMLSLHEPPNLPKNDYQLEQYKKVKADFDSSQLDKVVAQWIECQAQSVRLFKERGHAINSLFNKKGAKGMRRNSLRTIIRNEFSLFTNFFPVVLLNPSVCSSIIPLEEGIFDLVIFDEASQLRLEDTYAAMIRGRAKIVSGDKHQMAPSSYFEGSGALLDPIEGDADEDENDNDNTVQRSQINLADSESLLAFAIDKDFKESYLTVHYRSRHPYLIDFSNHAFYGKRLIPVPVTTDYIPIEFFQVNGVYENQTNQEEARQVVLILRDRIKPLAEDNLPSVGVATFNIYQRNLILEEIASARRESREFDIFMSRLGDSFFVKNLENIQGDERDIIIISSTFGCKPNGTFSQNFGPIIQGKGHRMLNVIITRAKDKVYICNSFPQEYVGQYAQLVQEKGNKGRAVLYAYLTYARAVSENNHELRNSILTLLSQYCIDQHYDHNEPGIGSESIFEDEVYTRLSQHIDLSRIEQQYKVGGFRIDMVVHSLNVDGRKIAIECDGAKYHSSPEAYAWDVFRQEQLEKLGFVFYRLWSTNWWDSADKELEKLLIFIHKTDSQRL